MRKLSITIDRSNFEQDFYARTLRYWQGFMAKPALDETMPKPLKLRQRL